MLTGWVRLGQTKRDHLKFELSGPPKILGADASRHKGYRLGLGAGDVAVRAGSGGWAC